ncbi:hypothetical protein PV327_007792 [Microctonus hyperodae]|uniref:Uncharacterized protein n=1 Tax=Microctonus hyperodae TaxID=165561 RepID=A0AA39G0C5_MICHY|nr:hypothetical protein PV327_007792 [Microctonus hyperodae]
MNIPKFKLIIPLLIFSVNNTNNIFVLGNELNNVGENLLSSISDSNYFNDGIIEDYESNNDYISVENNNDSNKEHSNVNDDVFSTTMKQFYNALMKQRKNLDSDDIENKYIPHKPTNIMKSVIVGPSGRKCPPGQRPDSNGRCRKPL